MRYSFISAAIAALVSSAVAQTSGFDAITSPTQDQNIQAGSSFDIVWEPNGVTGTVTISLLQGATFNTLEVGPVVASSIDNTLGKYTYTIPSSSSFATYGFKILLDSTANDATPTFQYSYPFHIVGGSSSSVSGSSASATSSGSVSGSTTTVHLSTGPSYTASSTVSSTTSTSISSSDSSKVVTTSSPSTTSSASLTSASGSNSTTLKTTSTKTSSSTSSHTSSTSSASPASSSNAAMSNAANSGLAMVGGIVLALAL